MTTAAHSTITDPYIHEPKGAAAAAANKTYVSNGSGSGTWKKITTSELDATSIFNTNKETLTFRFTDLSTPSSQYLVLPYACTVTQIYGALQGVIITADTIFTFRNSAGASMGTMTVAFSGSAAGDMDSLTPASNNTFTAGQVMKIDSDGGSANTVDEYLTILITRTA